MKEFELIEKISHYFSSPFEGVGIGDDAAAVKKGDKYFLITVDTLAENTHYRSDWKSKVPDFYRFLGQKLLAISVSDIVSMGGKPETAVVSFSLLKEFSREDVTLLAKGLSVASKKYGTAVVGGDTVRADCEVFSLTLTGYSENLMLRSEAEPGDLIAVSGFCGDGAGGLALLESEKSGFNCVEKVLIERFLLPSPNVFLGEKLMKLGVKACMDNSDGLLVSSSIMAKESGVSFHIESDMIPISDELKTAFKGKALDFALSGGEDFNLLFTFRKEIRDKILSLKNIKIVGEVKEGSGVFLDGEEFEIKGFEHF